MKKKFISILLCLTMILQGSLPGFAEEFIVWDEESGTAGEAVFEEMTEVLPEAFGEDLIIDDGLFEEVLPELSEGDGALAGELTDEDETAETETLESETEEPAETEMEELQERESSSEGSLENGAMPEYDVEGLIEEESEEVLIEIVSEEDTSEEMEVIELEDGIKVPDEVSTTYSFFRLAQYDGCFGNQLSGRAREIYNKRVAYYAKKRSIGKLTIVFDEPYTFITKQVDTDGDKIKPVSSTDGRPKTEYDLIKDELKADMQASVDAFLYDYSEVFWLRGGSFGWYPPEMIEIGNGEYKGEIKSVVYTPNEIYPDASKLMNEYDAAVDQVASTLQSNADIDKDGRIEQLELILTIHDYLCERLYYDTPAYEVYKQQKAEKEAYEKEHGAGTWKEKIDYKIFSSGGAFLDQVGTGVVCEGYAKAFKQLCDKLGVICTLIGGQVTQSTGTMGHMWNGVQLNGKWYLMDVTWDDSSTKTMYTYFMKGNRFSNRVSSGKISGEAAPQEFAYPILEREDLVKSYTKAATCTEEGFTVFTCINNDCDEEYTIYHKPLEHNYKTNTKAATCTEEGFTVFTCINNDCDEEYTIYHKPLEHSYKTNTKAATCTEKGYITYTCMNNNCDETYIEYHNPLGHTYRSAVTAPTCKKGYTTYTCTRSGCKHSFVGNEQAALGYHPYKNGICPGCGQGDTITKATISKLSSYGYDPKGVEPEITVKFGTNVLKEGTDYTVTYRNNTELGTAWATIAGIGKYRGTVSKSFKIIKRVVGKLTFPEVADKTYTGKAIKPAITIRNNGTKLVKDIDYTVKYSNNKNIGRASITIKLNGNYSGTQTIYFHILPKAVSIKTVKSTAKKKMKVTWKKVTGGSSYQLQYSLNSNFSGAKTVTVGASNSSKTLTKLTSKKMYYVRIRSYKKVSGKKYYSEWSKAKKVTIK